MESVGIIFHLQVIPILSFPFRFIKSSNSTVVVFYCRGFLSFIAAVIILRNGQDYLRILNKSNIILRKLLFHGDVPRAFEHSSACLLVLYILISIKVIKGGFRSRPNTIQLYTAVRKDPFIVRANIADHTSNPFYIYANFISKIGLF